MKSFHPFFWIGTVGMSACSILHIFMALVLSLGVHTPFFALYPTFLAFLTIGLGLTLKNQKNALASAK